MRMPVFEKDSRNNLNRLITAAPASDKDYL